MAIRRKLTTAHRLYAAEGIAGVMAVLRAQRPLCWFDPAYWFGGEQRWLGRLVEISGDRVRVEGCRFSVRHPAIPTRQKSLFWFDRYEIEERRALRRFLDPALPVVEFGGSIGVVACVVNRRLRDPEKHVVVEANAALLPLLEENRRLNNARFTVLHRAVAYGAPEVRFHQGAFLESSVARATEQSPTVRTVTLREILDNHGFDRCTLICDIEAEEVALIREELDVLAARVPTLVLETHTRVMGAEPTRLMLEALMDAGFVSRFRDQETWVWQRPELLERGALKGTDAP